MGFISQNKGEYLMTTDYGIMSYRIHIRKSIKSLKEGTEPK